MSSSSSQIECAADRVRSKNPECIEMRGQRSAVFAKAENGLRLGLSEMRLQRQCVVAGEIAATDQKVVAAMKRNGRCDCRSDLCAIERPVSNILRPRHWHSLGRERVAVGQCFLPQGSRAWPPSVPDRPVKRSSATMGAITARRPASGKRGRRPQPFGTRHAGIRRTDRNRPCNPCGSSRPRQISPFRYLSSSVLPPVSPGRALRNSSKGQRSSTSPFASVPCP